MTRVGDKTRCIAIVNGLGRGSEFDFWSPSRMSIRTARSGTVKGEVYKLLFQCKRHRGHGPRGLYCWQHGHGMKGPRQ